MRNGRRNKTKIDIDAQLSELGIDENGIGSNSFFDETTDDDDFLRQFEAEMNSTDRKSVSESVEELGGLEQEIQELLSGVANEIATEEVKESQESILETTVEREPEEGILNQEPNEEVETPQEILPIDQETGEVDLAGGSGDLEDLLQANQELSDLSSLFASFEEEPNEANQQIEEYANEQLQKSEEQIGQATTDSNEFEKKVSFIDKIKSIFRKKREAEPAKEEELTQSEELAKENELILTEMEKEDKKKKEKKQKKNKEKNVKQKFEKPPKEKKPKVIDNTPPLPKKPVALVFFMMASMLVLVIIGTSLIGYQNNIAVAKEYYSNANYTKAYQHMDGLKLKDRDKEFYNKVETLALVESEYEDYKAFKAYGDEEAALDSLICAAGRCDANVSYAENYDCVAELENLQGMVEKELKDNYNITFEEAVEIYNSSNRRSYTELLLKKMKELGIE